MKGDTIAGRFRVEKLLGVGSSGFVVAARHTRLDERVALKIITSLTFTQGEAVLDVARRVAEVRSPHIARVVDTGYTEEGYPFVATVLSEGRSVADLLLERGSLGTREAMSIVRQACEGLTAAHAAGIVHGDLKPRNLFLAGHGIELVDFGMTQPLESEESSAAWFASPAYLAPEQLRDPTVDARADIWALGVIAHELISGALPFEADTIAGMFVAVAYNEPALLSAAVVPRPLAKILRGCLAKNASARPQSARVLADHLAPYVGAYPEASASIAPQLAMAVSLDDQDEEALESKDLAEPAAHDNAGRMAAALRSASMGPPPLPGHRLGATPRSPMLPALRSLPAANGPDTRTEEEQRFQRRRWGAIGVVVAAGVLGLASSLAAPSATASASSTISEAEPVEALLIERPLDFGTSPLVPPSFALPEREDAPPPPPPPAFSALVVPPASQAPVAFRPRPRLPVRADPYAHPGPRTTSVVAYGFTHPTKLPEKPGAKSRSRSF